MSDVINSLAEDSGFTRSIREYLRSLTAGGNLAKALRGEEAPDREVISSIEFLLNQSKRYGSSQAFQEMIDFVGRFRDYAPYNNMLVRLQNPSCSFYATAQDWRTRFNREIKEDARPMLILAPMHPVMLVYELDQTEGDELPREIREFAHFEGEWDSRLWAETPETLGESRVKVATGGRLSMSRATRAERGG